MKHIHVEGISSKGTPRTINYVYPDRYTTTYDALRHALAWASEEYTCEWDIDGKLIPDSEYREFEEITKIEIIDD